MTKMDYLKQLENELRTKIPEQEMYDIMRDYAEYFEEGKAQGKTESQIIEALGLPYTVAQQILGESVSPIAETLKKTSLNAKQYTSKFASKLKDRNEQWKKDKEQKEKIRVQKDNDFKSSPNHQYKNKSGLTTLKVILKVFVWVVIIIPIMFSLGLFGLSLIFLFFCGIISISSLSMIMASSLMVACYILSFASLTAGISIVFGVIWASKSMLQSINKYDEPVTISKDFEIFNKNSNPKEETTSTKNQNNNQNDNEVTNND